MNLDKFSDWMRTNTSLSESSIRLYTRTIRSFFKKNDSLDLDSINQFVSSSFRTSRSYYVKYAFKHYLTYKRKKTWYLDLVNVKMRPRKRFGKYLERKKIQEIIEGIEDSQHKDIALIQYATAARAREIITLQEENIDLGYSLDTMRIRLEAKGGKERITFLAKIPFAKIIKKYTGSKTPYLFINADPQDPEDIERVVKNERTYYYNSLNSSAASQGIKGFGTHDFRRNAANTLMKKTKDLRLLQKVLGHASITTTVRYFEDSPEDVQEIMLDHQGANS